MERRLFEAPPEHIPALEALLAAKLRHLKRRRAILREDDYRVVYANEVWMRLDGEWLVERDAPSLHEMERNGRRPIIVSGDALDAIVAAERAKPSRGDIKDAFRGLEPTEVVDPVSGETREDFANIPLKNADGSLTKHAKNLMDLHAPAARAGAVAGEKLAEVKAKAS